MITYEIKIWFSDNTTMKAKIPALNMSQLLLWVEAEVYGHEVDRIEIDRIAKNELQARRAA